MTPVTMDENWLILMSKENDQHVLWNCHSQERLFPLPNETCERPVALMTNYSVGDMPSYMSYDYAAEKYSLRRGRDYFSLKNLLAPDLGPCRNIHPIDNRILAHGIYELIWTHSPEAKIDCLNFRHNLRHRNGPSGCKEFFCLSGPRYGIQSIFEDVLSL